MHWQPSISVSAVVLCNTDGEVALVRKYDTRYFIFPGGKPEPGETGADTARREVSEELGVDLSSDALQYLGQFTTPAANEAETQLHSEVFAAWLPDATPVAAQAEIAELIWVLPEAIPVDLADHLAPLSAQVLARLATEQPPDNGLTMSLEQFEELVGEELDKLPHAMIRGLDNVVFAVEDRPDDGELNLLGVYEGHDLSDRADYGFLQLPDRIVLFREPLLTLCTDEAHLREEVRITLIHEIAHYYGFDDAQLHELGWA